MFSQEVLRNCRICPRECGVNRIEGEMGFCKIAGGVKVAKAFLHFWEEPCISGKNGSGTVFFSGCNMGCVFCQNYEISQMRFGVFIDVNKLATIFLNLQSKGAHNINLVTPTIYVPYIIEAIDIAREKGLRIPIVYNTSSYEKPETLELLRGYVDIFLPDLKYFDDEIAKKYSNAPRYFEFASKSILKMVELVGDVVIENGIMKKGVIIRHLVLPMHTNDSIKILSWIRDNLKGKVMLSLMSQYYPMYRAKEFKEISRKITVREYQKVVNFVIENGLDYGYIQDKESATDRYTPDFDLEGI
ncbi:Radical SAM domain protein [Caldicellulosiruptor obsidiansis OB47]|uniref:Radical SAM domain protein n=1 Tax=Caldicellulosiruptor obsidiansis (strain ATCC BAA-2073 / JCM 16842 / OB47) TaxID=608506 RepID=D9TFR4_CALOO|nr:radical SAM protein [Caldicellulosiruptor obsidiansis]ADL43034.1 Radical SAM domain protein [Caldicellulosiruptor obsidiansis OB47]